MAADIRIRWVLETVGDKTGAKLLAQDRELRTSLTKTDAQYRKTAATAASAGAKQAQSAARTGASLDREGRATLGLATDTARYARAQRETLAIGSRLAHQADATAGAYSRQGRAVRTLAVEESRLAKARKGIGAVLGTGLGRSGAAIGGAAAGAARSVTAGGAIVAGALTVGGLKQASDLAQQAAGLRGLTGLTSQQAIALGIIAKSLNINARALGMAFGTLGKQVVGLEKGSKSSVEAFKALDISPQRVSQLKNNLPALFDLVFERTQKLPAAQRAGYLKQLLGRGGLVAGQVEALGPLAQQLPDLQKQLGGISPKRLFELHEEEVKLKEATTALELAFAGTFGPPLIALMHAIIPAIKPIGEALKTVIVEPIKWLKDNLPGGFGSLTKALKGEGGPKPGTLQGRPPILPVPQAPPGAPPILPKPGQRAPSSQELSGARPPTTFEKVLKTVGGILRDIGKTAAEAGKELGAAFKPAEPFFKNVLLPSLQITGKVLLFLGKVAIGATVIGFHVLTFAIKLVSIQIGAIGVVVRAAIGFFSKLGGSIGGVAGKIGGFFGRLPGVIGGFAGRVGGAVGRLASSAAHAIVGLPGKLAHYAGQAGSSVISTLGSFVGKAAAVGGRIADAVARGVGSLAGKIAGLAKGLFNAFWGLGRKIIGAMVSGLGSAVGGVVNFFKGLAPHFDVSLNPIHPHFHLFLGGNKVFREGGMVMAAVSPGEQIVYGDRTMVVPGARTARDSVTMPLPVGAAVITGHGQQMMAGGASISEALAYQRPHFARGGVVTGRVSTFGPPGEKAGKTASGVSSSQPGVAVRPGATWQTGKATLRKFWQVTIAGHTAVLQQTDLGPNESTGRRIDVTGAGARKMALDPRHFPTGSTGTATLLRAGTPTGGVAPGKTAGVPILLGRERRQGLVPTAVTEGIEAGTAGLTPEEIRRANLGARGAEAGGFSQAATEAVGAVTRSVTAPGLDKTTGTKLGKSADPRMVSMAGFASSAAAKFPKYVYGGGHSSFTGPFDCSGYVSGILHAGGFLSKPVTTDQLKTFGLKGVGKRITVAVRGSTGRAAHTMIRIGNTYWEAGRHGVGQQGGWDGNFPIKRHPKGYRRGGMVESVIPKRLRALITRRPSVLNETSPQFVGYGLRAGGLVGLRSPAHTGQQPAVRRFSLAGRASVFGPPAEPAGLTAYGKSSGEPGIAVNPTGTAAGWNGRLARSLAGRLFHVSVAGHRALLRVIDKGPFAAGRKVDITGAGARRMGFKVRAGGSGFPTDATAHIVEARRGGVIGRAIPRFQAGGTIIGAAVHTVQTAAGNAGALKLAVQHLQETAFGLTVRGLEQMRKLFVRQAGKPGSAAAIKSFQAAISAIDFALGLRIGGFNRQIEQLGKQAERGGARLDRSLRREGVDPASVRGLQQTIGQDAGTESIRRQQVAAAGKALAIAKKTGNRAVIQEQTEKLAEAQDELDEAITKGIEDRRSLLRQAAQDATDAAQFGVETAQNALSGLDIAQRLNRTAETPSGEVQKATAIESQLIPALQNNLGALNNQLAVLLQTGAGASEINQILLSIQTAGNEIGTAMAEAADLIRQAAEQAAQEVVEHAEHRTNLAQLGLQRLELEERIKGTYDSGGTERATYIKTQIIPDIEAEIAAKREQLETAERQGDPKLAEQIAEAIAGKQNDKLQAIVDSTDQTAKNTGEKKLGGTTGFAYGGENLTDQLAFLGDGA